MEELRAEGVRNEAVLRVMAAVPRHAFTVAHTTSDAYANRALPIAAGQTISQPLVVALMAEAADCGPHSRVLEIGTGSGYGAAVLAGLARSVVSLERIPELAEGASACLASLGYDNVTVVVDDGTRGWPGGAPYDAIVVTAAAPGVPDDLVDQLRVGGRLIIPVGDRAGQRLLAITRTAGGQDTADLGAVAFVPLVGEHGWEGATGA